MLARNTTLAMLIDESEDEVEDEEEDEERFGA